MERHRSFDNATPFVRLFDARCDGAEVEATAHASPSPSKPISFVIQKLARSWNVTMEGDFYGNFAEEKLALHAAQSVAQAICKAGHSAEIILAPGRNKSLTWLSFSEPR
ncbi:hypothetical protein [Asticcacaulis solisilvae]|uniref:hypothetical protein n=1 Tax=Asticcacaulis solisilvae TaxID=1217274 RepID=UPI003FD85E75